MNTPPPINQSPQQQGTIPPPVHNRLNEKRRTVLLTIGVAAILLPLFLFILFLLSGSLSGDGAGSPSEGSASNEIASSTGAAETSSPITPESNTQEVVDTTSEKDSENDEEDEKSSEPTFELTEEEKQRFSAQAASSQQGGLNPVGRDNVDFFGIRATADHVGFIIDKSGSMDGMRFRLAQRELISSLGKLEPNQSFSIFFYDLETHFENEFVNAKASQQNIDSAKIWINQIQAADGTAPNDAISRAFKNKCDVVFLLSDGEFLITGRRVANINAGNVPVHTVALETDSRTLQSIANENNGKYRRVR